MDRRTRASWTLFHTVGMGHTFLPVDVVGYVRSKGTHVAPDVWANGSEGMSMSAKARILVTLMVMGLVDIVIPLPLVAFLLIYLVLQRPAWFMEKVHDIYGTSVPGDAVHGSHPDL